MKQKPVFVLLTFFVLILLAGCTITAEPTAVVEATTAPTMEATATTEPTATTAPTTTMTPTPSNSGDNGQNGNMDGANSEVVQNALMFLGHEMSVEPSQLALEFVQPVTWPDGCLGVHRMGVLCTNLVTEGYAITFSMDEHYYEVNANNDGSSLIQVPGVVPPPDGVALTTENDRQCTAVIIEADAGTQSGQCDNHFDSYPFSSDTPDAVQNLHDWSAMYAPFHVDSPIGTINFNGHGDTMADPIMQRLIGEMTRWIGDSAVAEHTDPESQLVIHWHREGGIAGFCDDLTIYSYGKAVGTSCKTDPNSAVGEALFSLDRLEQLYGWIDQFSSFDYSQSDPADASDAVMTTTSFYGLGFEAATAADKEAIAVFASDMFAEFTANAPIPPNCMLTANSDVTVYSRPSTEAQEFGTLSSGETVQAMMRTDNGWLGFDPGVAQAANVGVFRMRWVTPDADVTQTGECSALPVAPQISPTACYFMAMAATSVYAAPDENSEVLAAIDFGGYSAVIGQTNTNWYQLDLQDSSLGQSGVGWLNPVDANFNGMCENLPVTTP